MDKNELIKCVEDFKSGDESKFEIIYLQTSNKLYNYIFSLSDSLNNEDCIELVQDTFIQVHNKIDTLKDSKAFTSWMFMIARNKTLRYLDKNKKEVLLSEDGQDFFGNQFETDIDLLPEEILDNNEKKKLIFNILESLPKEQKEVIYLRYYNELSVKEIAKKLNVSDGTVKSRLNYGRKKIQIEIEALEKKGTKLYGITGLPFILFMLRYLLNDGSFLDLNKQNMFNNIINETRRIDYNNSENLNDIEKDTYDNIDGIKDTPNNHKVSNDLSNNISNEILNKTSKLLSAKSIVAGLLSISVIGGGIFAYNNLNNKDEYNLSEIVESKEEKEDGISGETFEELSDSESIRSEVERHKNHVDNIYEIIKYQNLIGANESEMYDIDNFINEIKLEDAGDGTFYYSSTYPLWSSQLLEVLIGYVESVLESKNELAEIGELDEKEKEYIQEINDRINYFLDNQQELEALNDKLKEVAVHSGSERAQEYAMEFNEKFEKYKALIKQLR